MIAIYLIILLVAVRALETRLFLKRVSKVCYNYDWKVINDNPELLLIKMANKNYHLTHGWSAYNFLFMKGPSPLSMFLSFKSMTIETQYNNEVVDRLKQYEVI
jgi:hypothetical protein